MLNTSQSVMGRKRWMGGVGGQRLSDSISCRMYNSVTREKLLAYLNHLKSGSRP